MAKLNVITNGNGLETIEDRMYLSKVKIGEQVYYLKDEEVRKIVAGLKEGAFVDVFDGNINTDQDENNKCQLVKKGRYLIQMKEDPERNKDEVIGGRRRSRIKSGDCSVIRRRDGCAGILHERRRGIV